MNFLFPTFLFGLFAIGIPIIIHLFNFRKYKKVYFTNVQFLKELKQESDSKSKLKEWLILSTRILAIISLVFAFAQPYFPKQNNIKQGQKIVSVYIDNSFSLENINTKGTLLENAKQHALDIAKAFNTSDKFQLLTNDFEGKQQRLISKQEFIEHVNNVKITSASRQLSSVLKRQQDFLLNANSTKDKQLFILSDFQVNATQFVKTDIDTSINIKLIPITAAEVNNLYIDTVWFENPTQQFNTSQVLHATIQNKSNKSIENGNLKLIINDKIISISSFNCDKQSKNDISLNFKIKDKGVNNCILKLEDNPITFDDAFYFSFNSNHTINTLVINGTDSETGGNFKSLMQNDSMFVFAENKESAIDYRLFSKTNCIILNDLKVLSTGLIAELQKFISNGGSVIIFPNTSVDIANYNTSLSSLQLPKIEKIDTAQIKTQTINFEQGLYNGVFEKTDIRMDLPKINEYAVFDAKTNKNRQDIILLQNELPYLSQFNLGAGKVYLFSAASNLKKSNFLKHALFVPTIIKIGVLSLKASPIYYYTFANQPIKINGINSINEVSFHIIKENSTIDMIPEQRTINNTIVLFTQNQITDAGFYNVVQNQNINNSIAFNYNRTESDMSFYSESDLKEMIDKMNLKNISVISSNENSLINTLKETTGANKLWKLFLILALVFLLCETLLIRLLK